MKETLWGQCWDWQEVVSFQSPFSHCENEKTSSSPIRSSVMLKVLLFSAQAASGPSSFPLSLHFVMLHFEAIPCFFYSLHLLHLPSLPPSFTTPTTQKEAVMRMELN